MAAGVLEYLTLFVNGNNLPRQDFQSNHSTSLHSYAPRLHIILPAALAFMLSACAAPFVALGSSSGAAMSSAGSAAATAAIANPSTAVSLASTATTGKSPLEHAASAATKKDCSILNILDSNSICVDVLIPKITDYSEAYLGPADQASRPPQ